MLLALALALLPQEPAPPATPAAPIEPARSSATAACGSRVELPKIWTLLCAQHDADHDGRITATEYGRGETRFRNYDRDADGVLTARDFPDGAFVNGFNPWLAQMADRDRDRSVPRAEWDAFVASLDADDDGTIGPEELARGMGRAEAGRFDLFLLSFDQDLDGRLTRADMALAFADLDVDRDGIVRGAEMQRWRPTAERPRAPLPKVGEPAPPFELPRADDPKQTISLASFRGKRPVALIFGSYT